MPLAQSGTRQGGRGRGKIDNKQRIAFSDRLSAIIGHLSLVPSPWVGILLSLGGETEFLNQILGIKPLLSQKPGFWGTNDKGQMTNDQ